LAQEAEKVAKRIAKLNSQTARFFERVADAHKAEAQRSEVRKSWRHAARGGCGRK
jgi:hypothetical protein